MALVTLALAKDYLDIPIADTTKDTRVTRLINFASALIESYCERKFEFQTFTEFHDGRNNNQLLLRQWPAQKPSSVSVSNAWEYNDGVVDSSIYDVVEETTLVLRSGFFSSGYRNVKVVYQAGYATIPYDIQEACLMLVLLFEQKRNDKRVGVNSKSKQGENISFVEDIPEDIQRILEKYKRLEFAFGAQAIGNQ